MDRINAPNWDDMRILLTLSQAGSTARAAQNLGISHQTVARRVTQLERDLGAPLVQRDKSPWALTDTGRRMVDHAGQMQRLMTQARAGLHVPKELLTGRVSVSCTAWGFDFLVLPALKTLHTAHPELQFDLVASDAPAAQKTLGDLTISFADQPPPELISRRLGTLHFSLFGTPRAIARMEDALATGRGITPVVDFAHARPHRIDLKELGIARTNVTVTNDFGTLITAVRHGLGIAVLPDALGYALGGLVASTAATLPDSRIGIWSLRAPGCRATEPVRAAERAIARQARAHLAA